MSSNLIYYSQFNQDKIIDRLLRGKRSGYFIDIGAHDGISFSNSYFFEKYRNYNGSCFEANTIVFRQLEKNRNATCINAAISEEDGKVTFIQCIGYGEMLSGIKEFRDPRHIERTKKTIEKHGGRIVESEVLSMNLNNFLQTHQIIHIDFLSIDIEGGEYEILKTINFDSFDIKIICVELNYPEIENEIINLLNNVGYKLITKIDVDGLFIKRKSKKINYLYMLKLFLNYRYGYVKRLVKNKIFDKILMLRTKSKL